MNGSLHQLRAGLQRLHANGHPAGLPPQDADAFCRALSQGTPLDQAAERTGFSRELVGIVSQAGVSEVPAVLGRLIAADGRVASCARILRSAGTYPLVLVLTVALAAGIVFSVSAPVLPVLPLDAGPTPATPLLAALVVACGLLVALSVAVRGRLPVPPFHRGWERIEGYRFLACVRILVDAGASAPKALRAAAFGGSARVERQAEALARSLESGGGGVPGEPSLLHTFEEASFLSAARAGILPEALLALSDQRDRGLDREVAWEALRIRVVACLLAGLALLVVGVAFYSTYAQAVAG